VKDKYFSPNRIFPNGIPKPGPETYFLTPTGRVDFVERQAADWLSIHETVGDRPHETVVNGLFARW
jgi:hypothetical protein